MLRSSADGHRPVTPMLCQSIDEKISVKFGQLFYAILIGPRCSQNLTGHLVFTFFDTGGNYLGNSWWKRAQKQSCRDQLQQMSQNPFVLILNTLCDLSQKLQYKSLNRIILSQYMSIEFHGRLSFYSSFC